MDDTCSSCHFYDRDEELEAHYDGPVIPNDPQWRLCFGGPHIASRAPESRACALFRLRANLQERPTTEGNS
jgi:hypothetical protein